MLQLAHVGDVDRIRAEHDSRAFDDLFLTHKRLEVGGE
jgi:hypothetical protein